MKKKQIYNILHIPHSQYVFILLDGYRAYNFTSKAVAEACLIEAIAEYNDGLEERVAEENKSVNYLSQNKPIYYSEFEIVEVDREYVEKY